jgi:hypothetical protein
MLSLRAKVRGRGQGKAASARGGANAGLRLLRLLGSRDGGPARRLAARGLLALLLLSAVVWGSLEVRRRVHGDERHRLETWRIEIGDLPGWVTPDIRAEIEAGPAAGPTESWNLLEPGVLRRVQEAFEMSPWIRRAVAGGIRFPTSAEPGSLSVSLELRRPVAIIEHGRLYYLACAEGKRLGEPYSEPPSSWFGVPVVLGSAPAGPVPEPGSTWASRDVQQGIEVARILFESRVIEDFPERPVHAIDLSNLHGRQNPRESEIVLWCGRQRLAWGRSPISAGPRTVPVPDVVANLRYVLSHPDVYGGYALIHLHRQREDLTGVRG